MALQLPRPLPPFPVVALPVRRSRHAALLVAERIYKRKDAPLGVAGPQALGQQPVRVPSLTADPDIKALLDPYRRMR